LASGTIAATGDVVDIFVAEDAADGVADGALQRDVCNMYVCVCVRL
jgi:hypothetical protein